jgi:hypothetical protein
VNVFIDPKPKSQSGAAARNVLAVLLAVEAGVIVLVIAYARASHQADPVETIVRPGQVAWWRDNPVEPTLRPPVLRAKDAKIPPEEAVIGVEVGGKARAYRLAAFDDGSGHLVNDSIGGVPVSVCYCNLADSVRVYSDPQASAPLDAAVVGLPGGQMVIKLGGTLYFQKSGLPLDAENLASLGPTLKQTLLQKWGVSVQSTDKSPPIPYSLLIPTVTTWKEWKERHPGSEIFVGGR